MNKEIVKEQIIRSLEDILDQTHAIFENEGKVPQIEVDIIMANIRKLYEQYVNLNKFNIILSDPILSPTSRAYSARKAHERQLPKNEFKDPSKNIIKPIVVPEAKVESVTPVIPSDTEKNDEVIEEGKRPLLRFESYSEPEIDLNEVALDDDLHLELDAIPEFKIEFEQPVIDGSLAEKVTIDEVSEIMEPNSIIEVQAEKQPTEEEIIEIDAIINEIIAEAKEETEFAFNAAVEIPEEETEPIVAVIQEEPIEIPAIVVEPIAEVVTIEVKEEETPIIEPIVAEENIEITNEEEIALPSEEEKAEAPEIPSLFPDFIEPKLEPIKRKRPKSPLDLFADTSATKLGDKFQQESSSLNDRLSENKEDKSLAAKLQNQQITDLKKGVGINEKFLFINELFDGNMAEYNLAIEHINTHCTNLEEADTYIIFLKQNYNWDESRMSVTLFRNLMERRFPRQA